MTNNISTEILNDYYLAVADECSYSLNAIASNPGADEGDYVCTEYGDARISELWQDIADASAFIAESFAVQYGTTRDAFLDCLQFIDGQGITVSDTQYAIASV